MRELLTALRDALADPAVEQELIERLADAASDLTLSSEMAKIPPLQIVQRALEDLP